jgi:hypothetical protein
MILREVDTTQDALIDDVIGDAIAFAFSPVPSGGNSKEERAVILVRPRKMEALQKILDRLNELQSKSGQLKSVVRRVHGGETYFERQKTVGPSEYYCIRGHVFAFSSSETEVQAVIDRDKTAPAPSVKSSELVERMNRLRVADSAAVVLINPRSLDAELAARVEVAKPEEKRFLTRFAEAWGALETAAIHATFSDTAELGISVRFHPGRLPADLKKWLSGPASWSNVADIIPSDAMIGVTGHVRAVEVLDLLASIAPHEPGKPGVRDFVEQSIGPFFGREKVASVLSSLGPDWAVWIEAPVNGAFLPTFVAAIEINGSSEERNQAEKALTQGIEFGFQLLKVGYNANHPDQIELQEVKNPRSGVITRSLVNDKAFPPRFAPSFAVVKGYLVIATSPEPIQRFVPPTSAPDPNRSDRTIARLSGGASRDYLRTHGPRLVKFLIDIGITTDEKSAREAIEMLVAGLELTESVELVARPNENGLQIAVIIRPARPLKK